MGFLAQLLGAALRALFESLLPLVFAQRDTTRDVEGKLARWESPDAAALVLRGRASALLG